MGIENNATQIIDEIIIDLTDRAGFGSAWDSIDNDIQNEIKAVWKDIIIKIIS